MRRTRGRVYRRGGVWWCDYQVNGQRFRHALKDRDGNPIQGAGAARAELDRRTRPYSAKTEADRRQLAADALRTSLEVAQAADAAAKMRLPLAAAWQRYTESVSRPQSGESTLRQYAFQWQAFVRWVGANRPEAVALPDVTPDDGETYIATLAKDLAPGTVNKHRALLELVYHVLGEKEPLPHGNPFSAIKARRDVQHHRQELRPATLWKVFEAAEGEWKRLLFCGLYTGQRLADCALLDWSQVDLRTGWIEFRPRKTRRADTTVSVPIVAHLRAELERTAPEARTGDVMPEVAALYRTSGDRVTDRIQALFRRCGIEVYEPGTGPKTGKRAVLRYGFHSLRHSTATILQEAGAPAAVAEAILGHRSQAMRQRYTHVGRSALAAAMGKLPAVQDPDAPKALPEHADDLSAQIVTALAGATDRQKRRALAALKGGAK